MKTPFSKVTELKKEFIADISVNGQRGDIRGVHYTKNDFINSIRKNAENGGYKIIIHKITEV